jgi:Tol biopolymer transport system component
MEVVVAMGRVVRRRTAWMIVLVCLGASAAASDRASGVSGHAPPGFARVSVSSAGVQANGPSRVQGVSGSGRDVVFISSATNLVSESSNGDGHVYVHDRRTGRTTLVDRARGGGMPNGQAYTAAISANGRDIAYSSDASDLVAGDRNDAADIFVTNRITGRTRLVSVSSSGRQANRPSRMVSLSGNGRYVAFDSSATDLVAGDSNRQSDVFVYDMRTGRTRLVSVGLGHAPSVCARCGNGGGSESPVISADGRFVAFSSDATNLVPGDGNGQRDAFIRNLRSGRTFLVNQTPGGRPGNGYGEATSISAHGRYVIFTSDASDLVAGDTNHQSDVFLRDRATGKTTRVSVGSGGARTSRRAGHGTIGGHGRYIAFNWGAPTRAPELYLLDRRTGRLARVASAGSGMISARGRDIAFDSGEATLVPDDTNAVADVFEYHRPAVLPATPVVRVVTGTQNPRYRVTVTITPAHPATGDTIVATVRVVNRTKHRHRGDWTVTWETPVSGISAAENGIIKRGVVITDRETAAVTGTSPRGTYTISASIHDPRGTSHASVSVTVT